MSVIKFSTKLFKIGSWTILKLPQSASAKLPTRGMTVVEGTVNGLDFQSPLEPDGQGGHWMKFTKEMQENTKLKEGMTASLSIEVSKDWPEPEIPVDLKKALAANPKANEVWLKATPNAHWDWIRWIRLTKNPETRKHHIEVACSKLKSGMRRPCCFNRNVCSVVEVSKNWILLDPGQSTAN